MIRVMIRDQVSLSQVCLTIAMWNSFEEIQLRVEHKLFESVQVTTERGGALVPGGCRRRSRGRWPIVGGPVGRHVVRITAKLQNVVLRQPQMLQQLPGRIRKALWCGAT